MEKKIIKFDDTEIEKYEFHQYKSPISINDIDIDKIVVPNKFAFGKKNYENLGNFNNLIVNLYIIKRSIS